METEPDSRRASAPLMTHLPPILNSVSFCSNASSRFRQSSEVPIQAMHRPRQSLIQRLNDKYADSLTDNSLTTTRRLAAINAQNTKSQMQMRKQLETPQEFVNRYHENHSSLASNSVVQVLAILDRHKQLLKSQQSLHSRGSSDQPAPSPMKDPPAPETSVAQMVGSRPGTASKTALAQLAFQDMRRAAEIVALLEQDSGFVPVSPRRLTRRPERPVAAADGEGDAAAAAASSSGRTEGMEFAGLDGLEQLGIQTDGFREAERSAAAAAAAAPAPGSRFNTPASAIGSRLSTPLAAASSRTSTPLAAGGSRLGTPLEGPAREKGAGGKAGKARKARKGRSKGKSKPAEGGPASPMLRIGGPLAPFNPGMGTVYESPQQWDDRTRSTAQRVQQRNRAGFEKQAAISELSEQQEATERAHEVLHYIQALPEDRIAESMLRVAVQELRFRRPFFHVPLEQPARVIKPPAMVGCSVAIPPSPGLAAVEQEGTPRPASAAAGEADGIMETALVSPGRATIWVWNAESSVFAARLREADAKSLYDAPVVLEHQLAAAWKLVIFRESFRKFVAAEDVTVTQGLSTVDKALEAIRGTLPKHAATLRSVFAYYASRSLTLPCESNPSQGINLEQYTRCLEDMGVMTPGAKHNNPEACLAIFHVAKTVGQGVSTTSDDDILTRGGFFEALIRLASLKYCRLGPFDSLAEALGKLLVDNVSGLLPAEALHGVDQFRLQRLYVQDVHAALSRHLPVLQALFEWGCSKPGSSKQRMGLPGWLQTLQFCGLTPVLRTHVGCPETDLALIFSWSQLVVVNEAQQPQAAFTLSWPDFLEAVARLADLISPPPTDEVEVLLREVVMVPQDELEAVMASHPWHTFYTQLPAERVRVFRRPSARLIAEKSQPLGDKILAVMDYIVAQTMDSLEVKDSALLAASIVRSCRGAASPTMQQSHAVDLEAAGAQEEEAGAEVDDK